MKALTLIITMILAQRVFANNSCFDDQAVKDLIKASEKLNECFANDIKECEIDKMGVEQQRKVNSKRLIPFDRTKSKLMNGATGLVSADFNCVSFSGSGQKISSCHIITSAHLLYYSTEVSVDSQDKPALRNSDEFDVNFHSGQTCDSRMFQSKVGAQVFFKMTKESKDFACGRYNNADKCIERNFFGKSDLVILKYFKKL